MATSPEPPRLMFPAVGFPCAARGADSIEAFLVNIVVDLLRFCRLSRCKQICFTRLIDYQPREIAYFVFDDL
jgi:hypothetical protein